jgi:transcription antitermination factor NusG
MSQIFIPGLKREELCVVRKTRRLPIPGKVLVKNGDYVDYDEIIARAEVKGSEVIVDVYEDLHIMNPVFDNYTFKKDLLLKKVGNHVAKDEVIARRKTMGFITKTSQSPVNGVIEKVTIPQGRHPRDCLVHIRLPSRTTSLNAYIPGRVTEILENEGAVIETPATYIQGIFGIGPETQGELTILTPEEAKEKPTLNQAGKILVVEGTVDENFMKEAARIGIKAVILGSISDKTLEDFLGGKPDVVTGGEDLSPTLIVTEGFGQIRMLQKSFNLMRRHEGEMAFVNGATQMRAGVIRPEIIIPQSGKNETGDDEQDGRAETLVSEGIEIGNRIRIIRGPYFGTIGQVTDLPMTPITLESEIEALIVEMETGEGEILIVPRSNTEVI